MEFGFDSQADLEKLYEKDGHKHVYSPGAGADNSFGSIFFIKIYSVNFLCCKFSLLNYFVTVFSIQMYRLPNLTLLQNRSMPT